MCADCHFAPGTQQSEIREGLYPQPPNLTEKTDLVPAEMFWAIKHGIKMSAMPAWGKTHDDQNIWGIVAFLQQLPDLTPEQYRALVQSNSRGHEPSHPDKHSHSRAGKHPHQ